MDETNRCPDCNRIVGHGANCKYFRPVLPRMDDCQDEKPLSPRFMEKVEWMETESRFAVECPDLDQERPHCPRNEGEPCFRPCSEYKDCFLKGTTAPKSSLLEMYRQTADRQRENAFAQCKNHDPQGEPKCWSGDTCHCPPSKDWEVSLAKLMEENLRMAKENYLPTDPSARKAIPLCRGLLDYFPDALAAVAEVSRVGSQQHHPDKPIHWDRSKSADEADALMRHLIDRGKIDSDGQRHTAKVAWRALALLQKEIEAGKG